MLETRRNPASSGVPGSKPDPASLLEQGKQPWGLDLWGAQEGETPGGPGTVGVGMSGHLHDERVALVCLLGPASPGGLRIGRGSGTSLDRRML